MESEEPDIELVAKALWTPEELNAFLYVYKQSTDNWDEFCEILSSKSRSDIKRLHAWIQKHTDHVHLTHISLWRAIYASDLSGLQQDAEYPPQDVIVNSQVTRHNYAPTSDSPAINRLASRKRLFNDGPQQPQQQRQQQPQHHTHRVSRKRVPFSLIPTSTSLAPYKVASFIATTGVVERGPHSSLHFSSLRRNLSSPLARRFWICEFFDSTMDSLFYEKDTFEQVVEQSEFSEVLHMKLTRAEWNYIRYQSGKARRFSKKFLESEKSMLHACRAEYRRLQALKSAHGPTSLGSKANILLPTVGQSVLAIHPTQKSLHSGSILEVAGESCYIRFLHPNLGAHCIPDYQLKFLSSESIPPSKAPASRRNPMIHQTKSDHSQPLQDDHQLVQDGEILDSYRNIAKLCILLNQKEKLLVSTQQMNDEAEQQRLATKESLLGFDLDTDFQAHYASNIMSLDNVNAQLQVSLMRFASSSADIQDRMDQPREKESLGSTEAFNETKVLPVDRPQETSRILIQATMSAMLTEMRLYLPPESADEIFQSIYSHFLVLASLLTATHNQDIGRDQLNVAMELCRSRHPHPNPLYNSVSQHLSSLLQLMGHR